jgi:hypothetical protein
MKKTTLILLTPIIILLAHHLAVFIHEYSHALTAWILGYKNNPLDINYGGTSLANIFLLANIDQKVDNPLIYSLGHPGHVALIAFAGPGMILLLFFLSAWIIQKREIKNFYLLYFLFFFNLWCLGGTYAYVPIRTFSTQGVMIDIVDIEQALGISAWYIYFFVGYLVAFMAWHFFTKIIFTIYAAGISSTIARACLMIICVLLLFGYCGLAGFLHHGDISHFISATSFLAIPGVILLLWPTRKWVKEELQLVDNS